MVDGNGLDLFSVCWLRAKKVGAEFRWSGHAKGRNGTDGFLIVVDRADDLQAGEYRTRGAYHCLRIVPCQWRRVSDIRRMDPTAIKGNANGDIRMSIVVEIEVKGVHVSVLADNATDSDNFVIREIEFQTLENIAGSAHLKWPLIIEDAWVWRLQPILSMCLCEGKLAARYVMYDEWIRVYLLTTKQSAWKVLHEGAQVIHEKVPGIRRPWRAYNTKGAYIELPLNIDRSPYDPDSNPINAVVCFVDPPVVFKESGLLAAVQLAADQRDFQLVGGGAVSRAGT